MKRTITILAMLLIAATAYNQTSRKPANSQSTAERNSTASTSRSRTNGNTDDTKVNVRTTQTRTTNATNGTQTNTPSRQPATGSTRTENSNSRSGSGTNQSSTRTAQPATNTGTSSSERSYTRNSNSNNSSANRTSTTREQSNTTGTSRTTVTQDRKPVQQSASRPTQRSRTVDRTAYHTSNTGSHSTTHTTATRTAVRHEHSSPRAYQHSHTVVHHYEQQPHDRYYRARQHPYYAPVGIKVVWTPTMHRHYCRMYPSVTRWQYTNGYRIEMVSSYFANYYIGDVMTVYGQVTEVFYSRNTDEYFLYFGLYYPYQDFTVVLPGYIARRYSHRPEFFFENRYVAGTGLITSFNGEPEIAVRESFQLHLY